MFKVFVGAHTGLDRIQLSLGQLSNGLKTGSETGLPGFASLDKYDVAPNRVEYRTVCQ